MSIPTITTLRLMLRAFDEGDVLPLHRVMGGTDVLRYFPRQDPPSLERVQKLISGQLDHWAQHGYGWWAVVPRTEAQLIGWAGLQYLPETDEIEVAYLLGKPHWGQGLGTEAARASLNFGFDDLGLDRLVGIVHPENIASQRVLEKIGMSFVERTRYFGMDCYRYTIDRPSSGRSEDALMRAAGPATGDAWHRA